MFFFFFLVFRSFDYFLEICFCGFGFVCFLFFFIFFYFDFVFMCFWWILGQVLLLERCWLSWLGGLKGRELFFWNNSHPGCFWLPVSCFFFSQCFRPIMIELEMILNIWNEPYIYLFILLLFWWYVVWFFRLVLFFIVLKMEHGYNEPDVWIWFWINWKNVN